jgi:hypothetical protein
MHKSPLLCLLAGAILLSGCATLEPPRSSDTAVSRTYPDSRDAIWRRILSYSAGRSMFIRQADAANGVITVDREIVDPQSDMFADTIFGWAQCPRSMINRPLSQRIEINYVVKQERDGRTTVTMNGRFGENRMNLIRHKAQWVNCSSTFVLERSLLDSFYYEYRN